jgi:hypothetical protein
MTVIDKRKAKSLLRQVVQANGRDHASGICRYYDAASRPRCIVGHILTRAGVDGSTIVQNKTINDGASINSPTLHQHLLENYNVRLTHGAVMVLMEAQYVQDGTNARGNGLWGKALDKALTV